MIKHSQTCKQLLNHSMARAVQRSEAVLCKVPFLHDVHVPFLTLFSELPFITQVISQVLKNGPPAIPPHGERSGAELVRSLQDTLSALSVSQSRSVS